MRFKQAVNEAELRDGFKVLDLGGGGNDLLKYFKKRVDYTVVDYDRTRKMYNPQDKNFLNYNLEEGLPPIIKKQKFDVIFMLEFLEHIENFRTLLEQCRECLTENGKIVITTPTNHRFILGEDPTHIHCFRKSNFNNLAKILGMKIKIMGTYIRIPKLEIMIPSKSTFYTEVFLVVLRK